MNYFEFREQFASYAEMTIEEVVKRMGVLMLPQSFIYGGLTYRAHLEKDPAHPLYNPTTEYRITDNRFAVGCISIEKWADEPSSILERGRSQSTVATLPRSLFAAINVYVKGGGFAGLDLQDFLIRAGFQPDRRLYCIGMEQGHVYVSGTSIGLLTGCGAQYGKIDGKWTCLCGIPILPESVFMPIWNHHRDSEHSGEEFYGGLNYLEYIDKLGY